MNKYEQKPIYERNEDFEKNKTNNIVHYLKIYFYQLI